MHGLARRLPASAGSPTGDSLAPVIPIRRPGPVPALDDDPASDAIRARVDAARRAPSRSYAWGGLRSRIAA
jgi:hypothetical protein